MRDKGRHFRSAVWGLYYLEAYNNTEVKKINSKIDLDLPVIHQYWMDSGLLGFYYLADEALREDYVLNESQKMYPGINISVDDSGVHLKGTDDVLERFLNDVYHTLLDEFYNTSSPKQIEANAGFYYDSQEDEFIRFPKVKPMGISAIIFDKAPRPTGKSVSYLKAKDGATKKNQLPKEYAHLQNRLDDFLIENKLKADGATFLIDGKNAYQPKVNISVKPKKSINKCYFCGRDSCHVSEISGTVFPLITGSTGIKSFNSGCENPFLVCDLCDYIGKFVPASGYYSMNKYGDTFVFLPYSQSFSKMIDVFSTLNAAKKCDENRFRNYEENLGVYFQKPYEQFFSFLYTIYLKTCTINCDSDDEECELDLDTMLDINISKAPLSYYVLHFQTLGQTLAGKLVWNFTDAVYVFRLFSKLNESGINLKEVMTTLIDFSQDNDMNKTLVRNKVCERILKKQYIVDLIERFVYHTSRSENKFIKPLAEFAEIYEKTIYEGDIMKQDLIDIAVKLGKTIGSIVGDDDKRDKGVLFRLRKTRKPEDFLSEISRIQMKYDVSVTKDIYEKGELFNSNFNEFKQFCMIAALNSYNAKTSEKTKKDIKKEIKS